jgi:hypothetical protein
MRLAFIGFLLVWLRANGSDAMDVDFAHAQAKLGGSVGLSPAEALAPLAEIIGRHEVNNDPPCRVAV